MLILAPDNSPSEPLDSEQLDLRHRHQTVLIPANMHVGSKAFLDKRGPVSSPARWSGA